MIFNAKNKIIIFLLLLISGLFLIAQPADAFIFDWAMAALEGLDVVDIAILSLILRLIVWAFLSSAFALLGANLLEWAIDLPLHLSNPAVLGGWNFVLGFVNLGFVLALIFIALAYIMRLPRYELKKTLPRLILVILLVNFSMLIIGMFADIAQFFMNTLLSSFGKSFVELATMPLRQNLGILTNVFMTTLLQYIAAAASVFLAPVVAIYLIMQITQGSLLGDIFSIITMTIMNLLMGGIFLVYAVLFIIRIAALWILAIFSPLAFFCIIFDQTKKYFDKWFKMVVGWAFLGVVALFLLGIIISLFSTAFLSRPGNINLSGGTSAIPSFSLPPSLYNYLFLIIFLAVAFHISITYVPTGADAAIGYIKKGFASMGGVAGVINKGKRMGTEVTRRAVPQKYRQKVIRKARKMSAASTPTETSVKQAIEEKGKIRGRVSGYASASFKRKAGTAILSLTSEASKKATKETEKKLEGKTVEEKMKFYEDSKLDKAKRLAAVNSMIEEGQIDDALDEERFGKGNTLKDKMKLSLPIKKGSEGWERVKKGEPKTSAIEDIYTEAINQGDSKARQEIEFKLGNVIGAERIKEIRQREGDYSKKEEERDKEKGWDTYIKKIAGEAAEKNKVDRLSKDWFKKEEFMDAVHSFWDGRSMSKAAETFSKKFVDRFNETRKPAGFYFAYDEDTRKIRNTSAPKWASSTGAATLGVMPIPGVETKEDYNEKFKEGVKNAQEQKEWGPNYRDSQKSAWSDLRKEREKEERENKEKKS